jgi:diaminohydroxyphosphoribosylaminopyrimidine deaminase/5-amino-6-(5-phosphoribosylamino)uracil reductase
MSEDEKYMRLCLALAAQADGRTSPNPLVGAVLVDDDGSIIAEGYHQKAGQPHAEVLALDQAGERARGKTLYVNLEPCCHFGKTPPCSQRVIASGVKTVVFGMLDPNPKVQGDGLQELNSAGIETRHDVLVEECRYLNRGFLKWIEHGRPWVCLKIAATIDGRIADRMGHSKWITGEESRHFVHQLRDKYDCLLVGSNTVVHDDPEFTVRDIPNSRNPLRAVVDTHLSVSPQSKICGHQDDTTWIFSSASAIRSKGPSFNQSVRLVESQPGSDGHLDLDWVLRYLGQNRVRKVLCEGGAQLAGSLLQQQLVDELIWMIAPKLLLDSQSKSALSAPHMVELQKALILTDARMNNSGNDFVIHGFLQRP